MQSQKWQNNLSLFPRKTIQHHSNTSLIPNHWCWRSWSWPALWRPATPFRTNTKIRCPFHHRVLECKSRKSRDTWNNRQVWPCSTKWSRAKANRVLPRKCTSHSKHPLPTTQEKTLHMDITKWSISKPDWLYSLQPKMEKLHTVSKNKHYFTNKGLYSQSYGFSSSLVCMWMLDHKESKAPKNWCFWTVVLEKIWESIELRDQTSQS